MVGYNMNGPTRDQVLKLMEEKDRIEREIAEMNLVLETNHVGMNDTLLDPEGYPRNDIDVYQVRHARHRIILLHVGLPGKSLLCSIYSFHFNQTDHIEELVEWKNYQKNDHKEMMKLIERGLHTLHADFRGAQGESPTTTHNSIQPMEVSASQSNGNGYLQRNGNAPMNGHTTSMNDHAGSHDVDLVVEATRDLGVSDRAFLKVNLVSPGSPAEEAGIQVDDEVLQFGSITARNFSSLAQVGELVRHSVGARLQVRLRRGARALHVALVPAAWAGRGLLGCNIVPL